MGSSRGLFLKPGHQSSLLCKSRIHQLLWGGQCGTRRLNPGSSPPALTVGPAGGGGGWSTLGASKSTGWAQLRPPFQAVIP